MGARRRRRWWQASRRAPAAVRAQRVRQVREPVVLPQGGGRLARGAPQGHGGLQARRLDLPRRGAGALPRPGSVRQSGERKARPAEILRRCRQPHRGLPIQPQRLAQRHRVPLLAGRAAPGDDAPPGAVLLGLAVAVHARPPQELVPRRREPLALHVPKRQALLRRELGACGDRKKGVKKWSIKGQFKERRGSGTKGERADPGGILLFFCLFANRQRRSLVA
mmetsp:Transcript_35430/g.79945  ORF Transcript_35430/g.79945 Transcript_35430/m.79945 type:complete len:222 (+) Transcript_35430:2183-2848(+)